MFGDLTFMVAGRMACGVVHDELMVRVGPDGHRIGLGRATYAADGLHRPADAGMVYVDPSGIASDADLAYWVHRAVTADVGWIRTFDVVDAETRESSGAVPASTVLPGRNVDRADGESASTRWKQTPGLRSCLGGGALPPAAVSLDGAEDL